MSADEHVRAVQRDEQLLDLLGKVLALVDPLVDRVAKLERDLLDERTARERLELRMNAQWLRDHGYGLTTARELELDDALASRNVVPLHRDEQPDAEGDDPDA